MSNIAVIDQNARPSIVAGAKPQAIVPQDMDSAYRMAKAVCMAGMAPKGLDTPEKAMVAIMHGLEIGLTPMAALQRIAVVNGRPTIWGDGAIGLVRGSGLCEWIQEWIEGEGDNRVAICEAKRRGEPGPIRRKFSVADAKDAGLWGKAGPWQQFKERMMQMRARAFCLRDGFADVLGGLYIKEEIEDERTDRQNDRPAPPKPHAIEHKAAVAIEPETVKADATVAAVAPTPPKPPVPPRPPGAKPQQPAKVAGVQESSAPAFDGSSVLSEYQEAADLARDEGNLNSAWDEIVEPVKGELFPPDLEAANTIYRKALERVSR